MAIHNSIPSLVIEGLIEKYLVSAYCLSYRKDYRDWGSYGCFGHPASVLLFSIADTLGSYVIGKKPKKHFDILAHPDYYNFQLTNDQLDKIYKYYRGPLTHNSAMPSEVSLDIGKADDSFYSEENNKPLLLLTPFLKKTKYVLTKFFPNVNGIIKNSNEHSNLLKKNK
jgi:hypothetical protein